MEKKQKAADAELGLDGVFILIECSDGTLRAKRNQCPFHAEERQGQSVSPPPHHQLL